MTTIDLLSLLLPVTMQTAVVVLMTRRRQYHRNRHPVFFTYTLYSITVNLARLFLIHWPAQYKSFYWGTEILYGVLALLALNEVIRRMFELDYKGHYWLRALLLLIVFGIGGIFFSWSRFHYFPHLGLRVDNLTAIFLAFIFGVHCVEGMLLVLFVLLWLVLGSGWNQRDFGILLGFGLSAIFTISSDIIVLDFRPALGVWYRYGPELGYVVATAVWLHSFWQAPTINLERRKRLRAVLEESAKNNALIAQAHEWLKRRKR